MSRNSPISYLFVVVIVTLCEAADNSRPIDMVKTVSTKLLAPGRYSRFKCDLDGNIYLRVYTGDNRSPVVRVSPDGKTITTFALPSVQDLSGVQDFWVTSDTDLYVLAEKAPDEGYVLSFDADGTYKNKVRLDIPIRPNQIAVFASGDFLVAGREPVIPGTGRSVANGPPFVGIFNNRGQLLKRIQLRKDVKPNPKQPLRRADLNYAEGIVNSATEPSDDGKVYFMRRGVDGPIYAISPSGIITKTIHLTPPKGASLSTIKVASGRLAAEFVRNTADNSQVESVITQIIDLTSGKKVAEYSSVPPLGPDLLVLEEIQDLGLLQLLHYVSLLTPRYSSKP